MNSVSTNPAQGSPVQRPAFGYSQSASGPAPKFGKTTEADVDYIRTEAAKNWDSFEAETVEKDHTVVMNQMKKLPVISSIVNFFRRFAFSFKVTRLLHNGESPVYALARTKNDKQVDKIRLETRTIISAMNDKAPDYELKLDDLQLSKRDILFRITREEAPGESPAEAPDKESEPEEGPASPPLPHD